MVLVGFPLPVQPFEGVIRHQDLAADLKLRRPAFSLQLLGNVRDSAGIGRHVVAHHAVAAGEGPEQLAVPVGQADGRTVELELTAVCERDFQGLGGPFRELLHLADAVGIAQREHRILVRILRETRLEVAAHAARRGVRRGIFRIFTLQVLQLVHQLVVLVVRHRRRVLYVVLPAVLPKNRLQLLDALFRLREIHTHAI